MSRTHNASGYDQAPNNVKTKMKKRVSPLAMALILGLCHHGIAEETAGTCIDSKGQVIADDCNGYIESLYAACPDPSEVQSTVNGTCVPVQEFRRPLIGCNDVDCDLAHPYAGYTPFAYEMAADIYKVEGNIGADTIVIFLQGGPEDHLLHNYGQFMERQFLVAYVGQTNFLKRGLLESYDMTVEQADREIEENIALVHATYQDLRIRFPDRRFVLMGHSMGSFLTLQYLVDHGNPFDRVVAMAGRVDAPLDFVRRFAIGQNIVYNHIGDREEFRQELETYSLNDFGDYLIQGYEPNAETSILASLGLRRYSELLADVDLSNMLYLYSARDEQLGGLSVEEVTFLETSGATVGEIGWEVETLGHSRMLLVPGIMDGIIEFISRIN